MTRVSSACSWGLALALSATSARAADDLPPPLSAPAEAGPVNVPSASPPASPPVATPSRGTTNLLRPRGVAAPRSAAPVVARPVVAPTTAPRAVAVDLPPPIIDGPPTLDEPPPLDGPPEMRGLPDRRLTPSSNVSRRRGPASPTDPVAEGDAPPPLTLEPAGASDLEPLPDSRREKTDKARDEPPPRRPARRFGLFSTPPARSRASTDRDDTIRVEPRSDPAADAALKRRLEARVKDAVGDRARDIEVRVLDRDVVIRARVDRFWNRRAVRKTIEGLPALSGYKARVEIGD